MKITKNPVLGTWEMAESDQENRTGTDTRLAPCDALRILVVDDEEAVRSSIRKVLAYDLPDCVFDMASNGEQAVARFVEGRPGIVLMDLFMPVMNGEQAFYCLMDVCAENGWQSPAVIFLTGYDPSQGVRNVVAGDPAHCLLQKPVSNQTLQMAVKKRMERFSR